VTTALSSDVNYRNAKLTTHSLSSSIEVKMQAASLSARFLDFLMLTQKHYRAFTLAVSTQA
jgi:hypothetical protein